MRYTERQKPRYCTATIIALAVSFLFSSLPGTYAEESVSVDSPSLLKGYGTYGDLTDTGSQVAVSYGDGIVNTLKNSNNVNCPSKASNAGNNGDTFYFATCSFPNITAPSFTANANLLSLWQAGNEDIRSDIVSKAKFGVYSKLFLALKYTYAYNKGYMLYEQDNAKLSALNGSYFDSIEQAKKGIPTDYLLSHSGTYKVEALDFLWQTPEIAPNRFYTKDQYDRYSKWEATALSAMKKVKVANNRGALVKLQTSLLKVLKDPKAKTDNDSYLLNFIAYQMTVEKLGGQK